MKRRILVTAISGNIGNGILKILAEDCSNELYGCDVNEIAVGMDLVKYFWKCKYAVEEGYIDELLGMCRMYKISHLIVVNEREMETVSAERKRFQKYGIKVLIQNKEVLDICLDKYETMKFLETNGIPIPKTYLSVEEIIWEEEKRYILKPRKSNGSKGIKLINKKEDLRAEEIEESILQEYIDGNEEYTVGVFRQNGITNIIVFQRTLCSGYSYLVDLKKDKSLTKLAKKIAELFSLEGFFNIQLRKKNGKVYVFEINPRISGTVRFRHMLGFKDVQWWLDLLDGKTLEQYECTYDTAIGIRELNEKFLVLK
jgi:carbamoyl-phosphate synthase large subunit